MNVLFEKVVDWFLKNIFTFNPILSITVEELLLLYMEYLLVSSFIALLISIFFKEKREPSPRIIDLPLAVFEELLFRGVPLTLFGSQAAIYAHFIWALLHLHPTTIAFAAVFGTLCLRLWLGGLWIEAIFIHVFHNLLAITINNLVKRKED